MCLYPRLIRNPKYRQNKKNGGNVPILKDKRALWVPVGCQKCMECAKQRANNWSIRLQEEIKTNRTGKFVTLTFSEETLIELNEEIKDLQGYERENEIATLAVKRFRERWRKQKKYSLRYWLVTELGQKNTERIHLHGIIFDNDVQEIKRSWEQYGEVWIGGYVNERTINYITKYVTKPDPIHLEYRPVVFTSNGMGAKYIGTINNRLNTYKGKETNEMYTCRNGVKKTYRATREKTR